MASTLTPQQCRRARLLLGWSMRHLTELSDVSMSVIGRFEAVGEVDGRKRAKLRATFEAAGIQFVSDFNGGSVVLQNWSKYIGTV